MIPPFAQRFLAGETAPQAIAHAEHLQDQNVGTILNLLGEHYTDRTKAAEDTQTYCQLVTDLSKIDARACISVKPTQLGLDISEECFRDNLATLVDHAKEHGVFVWIDMEDHTTTAVTLDAFEAHAEAHQMGLCVQANLKRTADDLERLADVPGKVRLVKGAYDPPEAVAYQTSERVDEAMRENLAYMFEHFEDGIGLGSHDPEMITLAADLHEKHGTPYEIQMLMGVRTNAQYELAGHHDVWQYVPYGTKWPSYFYRRLTERTENLAFVLRALSPV